MSKIPPSESVTSLPARVRPKAVVARGVSLSKLVKFADEMRKKPTTAESILKNALETTSLRFTFQKAIAPYNREYEKFPIEKFLYQFKKYLKRNVNKVTAWKYRRGYRPAFMVLVLFCLTATMPGISYAQGGSMDSSRAVIHHTADKDTNRDQTVEQIDTYHKSKGWDGIGYHFLIRKDGLVYEGRPIWKVGAHARTGRSYSRNHYIGIALTGYDEFTTEQVKSLKILLRDLEVKQIERHHEECPGPGLNVEKIQEEIEEMR